MDTTAPGLQSKYKPTTTAIAAAIGTSHAYFYSYFYFTWKAAKISLIILIIDLQITVLSYAFNKDLKSLEQIGYLVSLIDHLRICENDL